MYTVKEQQLEDLIYNIRGKQVMLDSDLSKLYGCKNGTKDINKAVSRNLDRFSEDFYFQLTSDEIDLWFQSGTAKINSKSRTLPHVFTEEGIAMFSTVLRTENASKVSIDIMRTFVKMRKFINDNKNIFKRITKMEYKMLEYDDNFERIFNALEPK